ncbi:MAG: hypothetical protein GXP25_10330 [Planctomycetes bacterium]|nr:hypothetical protein [Planctomycetota bacterium]
MIWKHNHEMIVLLAVHCLLPIAWADGIEGPNVVSNPGFEQVNAEGKPVGWGGPAGYRICKDNPHTGAYCLRYDNDDPKRYHLYSIPLTLEKGRRYAIEGWVRTENVKGEGTGATICIEFYGADNKFLGGCYPSGKKGTNTEWQRVRAVSKRVPQEMVRSHMLCYMRRGNTGTAWWDDVSVQIFRAPLVSAMTTDRYRGETTGGPVTVKVGLNPLDYDLAPKSLTAKLSVKDGNGNGVQTVEGGIQGDVATFQFDSTPLKPGTYTVECLIASRDGKLRETRSCTLKRFAEQPEHKAYVDEHLRLILDGEPFFPLGLYMGRAKEKDQDLIAKSPFNCLMPYGSPNREELDMAQARGIRIIYSIKDYYAGTKYSPKHIKTPADERPAIEKKVNSVKDHPAIMAWYINDELPITMMDRLNAHRDWMEELDPGRPTWVVLYQKDQVRDYLGSFDVIGTDPYPIPQRPAGTALEYARKTVDGCFGMRAVWMVPQIFNWASYRKEPDAESKYRSPTLLEMRSMAWQCIAAGANGLVFYSYSDLLRRAKKEPFDERWRDVTAMAGEIKRFVPVLLSVEPVDPPTKVDAPGSVAWRLYAKEGKPYLVVVNSGDSPAEATFLFAKSWSGAEVLVGEKDVTSDGGTVHVPLAPLEPKVVRLMPAQ